MKNIFPFIALLIIIPSFQAFSQPTSFTGCPDSYVITYKNGTNCSATAYNFYTMNLAGTVSATPFGTSVVGEEINGIGISPIDGMGYGMIYTRTTSGPSCIFSNTRFIRFGQNGVIEELGTILSPPGFTISTAIGTLTNDGKYLFLATNGSNSYIGVINGTNSLIAPAGAISETYKLLNNLCPGKLFSDWALNPLDGNLYSYGLYLDAAILKGTVLKINPTLLTIDCVGTPNATEFLSAQDNFGGVMFGTDNFLYGLNINTRKFYKIDPLTGTLTLVSTIPGSGTMRGDLASCASASVVLPLKLLSFTGTGKSDCTTFLQWKTAEETEITGFEIEEAPAGSSIFSKIAFVPSKESLSENNYSLSIPSIATGIQYRLKIIENTGLYKYSKVVAVSSACNKNFTLKVYPISATQLNINITTGKNQRIDLKLLNMNGAVLVNRTQQVNKGSNDISIDISSVAKGTYLVAAASENEKILTAKFTKL